MLLMFFTFVVHLQAFFRRIVVVHQIVVVVAVVENRYCCWSFGQQLVGIQCGRIP